MEPMVCHDCRELVSVVVADFYSQVGPDLNSCPRCGGARLAALSKLTLGEQASAGGFRLRRRTKCPRCGAEMTITPTGHWG
jgi:ribosomal protein S27AE